MMILPVIHLCFFRLFWSDCFCVLVVVVVVVVYFANVSGILHTFLKSIGAREVRRVRGRVILGQGNNRPP